MRSNICRECGAEKAVDSLARDCEARDQEERRLEEETRP